MVTDECSSLSEESLVDGLVEDWVSDSEDESDDSSNCGTAQNPLPVIKKGDRISSSKVYQALSSMKASKENEACVLNKFDNLVPNGKKGMAGYKSLTKNNICAHLDLTTPNAKHYTEIITFLRRSRFFTAISTIHVPYHPHQQDFWASADIDCEVEPPVIRCKVLGRDVDVSAEHIRRVGGFQDSPDQLYLLDRYLVRGCFMRCKYEGDLGVGILNKAYMSPQFKYLAHVLIHCLGSRRGGFDDMRETIQCAFVALVLNRPFNFSEMVFTHMKENVALKGDKKFLMYPRFLQQLIDAQLPDLPKINADIIKLEHMNDITLNRVMSYRGKDRKPTLRSLFGHLSRPDYIGPPGRRWRHDDSDSEVEDIIVPGGDEDDGDCGAGSGGDDASGSMIVSTVACDVITTTDVSLAEAVGVSAGAGVSTSMDAD
ncbi:hypothetical protein R6Q57_022622 [Mikania cordata]